MAHKAIMLVFVILSISVSAKEIVPPETFGVLPSVYDAAISPDAKQLAVISNFQGTYGVRVISLRGANEEPRVILLGEGVKPMWVKWANDDRVLVGFWQSSFIRGAPITSSFIFTLDTNKMTGKTLIEPRKIFRQNNSDVIDHLESDPDHILMGFSEENQFVVDVKEVDVATGKFRRVKRGKRDIQSWYTDRRGEARIGQGRSDRSSKKEEWKLTIRDADDNKWRDADNFPGLSPDTQIFGFTNDLNELVIGDYAEKATLGLYVYDLLEKRVTRKLFHHEEYDAAGIVVNSDSDEVIGARYVADTPETVLFGRYDSLLGQMRKRFADFVVSYIDQSNDGRVLIFKISNSSEPGALVMFDASDNEPKLLTYYRPELASVNLGGVVPIAYKARDAALIPGYVTLPASITSQDAIKNLPFIVLPHGGPYARTSKQFDYFAQFFASRGFGVLQMNFRGSSGYGKTFEDSGRSNWVVMQEDVTDGALWLLEKGYADPDKICIAGWSYGGYAALMGAIKHPDLYSCAISMAGVTDLNDLITDIGKYRFGKLDARQFVLEGFADKNGIKENSPAQRASDLQVPLFLAHGTQDQRVHFDQFKRMKSALRKSPTKVTYVEFEDEDHFLSEQKNRQEFFVRLDKFLTETIGVSENASEYVSSAGVE